MGVVRIAACAFVLFAIAPLIATSKPEDLRIPVSFELFVPASMPAADQKKAHAAAKDLATQFPAQGYRNYFTGCYETANAGCPNARIAVAIVFDERSDSKSPYNVRLIAHPVVDERAGSALALIADISSWSQGKPNPLLPQDAQLQGLLGTPVLSNGLMTIVAYSPYMQLVPETATDRKYMGSLQHDLFEERIQTVFSQYTGVDTTNALASGTGTRAGICENSPRYLHYNVSIAQRPRPLEAQTVLHVQSSGQIIDCVNPGSRLTFGDQWDFPVATTKSPLASFVNLLGILFISKTNSWTNVATAGTSFSSLVDVDPSSTTVEQEIYDRALVQLVRDMCATTAQQSTEAPPPPPTPTPPPGRNFSGLSQGGSTTGAGVRQAVGVGEQSIAQPPPVVCESPAPNGGQGS